MVVRRIKMIILFLVCFLLQGNGIHYLSVFGGVPDLILVLIVTYTFLDETGSFDGLIVGTAAGFLKDICYGQIVGSSSLLYLGIGFLMFYMKRRLNNESRIILFFVAVISTGLYRFGQWLIYALFTQSMTGFFNELIAFFAAVIWNFLLLLIIRSLIGRRRRRSGFMFR